MKGKLANYVQATSRAQAEFCSRCQPRTRADVDVAANHGRKLRGNHRTRCDRKGRMAVLTQDGKMRPHFGRITRIESRLPCQHARRAVRPLESLGAMAGDVNGRPQNNVFLSLCTAASFTLGDFVSPRHHGSRLKSVRGCSFASQKSLLPFNVLCRFGRAQPLQTCAAARGNGRALLRKWRGRVLSRLPVIASSRCSRRSHAVRHYC